VDPEPSLLAIGIFLSLLVLAFTSAVEAALTAISRHRLNVLQEEDTPRATLVAHLLADPYRFKVTVRLLDLAAMIVATSLTLLVARSFSLIAVIGCLALLLVVILIFCEALPRAIALHNVSNTARLLAGPMVIGAAILWPFAAAIGFLTRPIVRALSGTDAAQHPLVTEEELRLLVNVGEEEGLIEPNERDMIEGIFSFGDTLVREIMIPRVDIIALDEHDSVDLALDMVIANGHSRIPVFHETIDQVIGILYAKDLLPYLRAGRRDVPLTAILRPPHFVPETMKVDMLLKDLQARRVHLAVVVDEYGGTAGLATIEDLLEQIVGDIQDEYDTEEPEVQRISNNELIVDARVLLDDLNDLTGLDLASEESDRIGGLIYEQLGRVPLVGDEVQIGDDVLVNVLSVEGLRPRRLRIRYSFADDNAIGELKEAQHGERAAEPQNAH
jgi:CBS domain containing-hemolysin-like protein